MSMFCPKCGNPDQLAETYCRRCGIFLPDLSKPQKKEYAPEENIKVNSVLSLMTVIVCFTLAGLLYAFLGFRPETPVLIYLTAGLLIAMGGWHIQTFIRSRKLKKQFASLNPRAAERKKNGKTTGKLLDTPNFEDIVPASVTDRTTRQLQPDRPSTQSKH